MAKRQKCFVCKKVIQPEDWDKVKKQFRYVIERVDEYGEAALTENQQILWNGKVHAACYENLY